MLEIRQAVWEELNEVTALYDGVIDRFQKQTGSQAWTKGVYPSKLDFREAIRAQTLYVGEMDGRLAAGMIITPGTDEAYGAVPWQVAAVNDETAELHTLGVSPDFAGQGLGLQMAKEAQALARKQRLKALRLDVLESNIPARRLYERAGFQYITTKKIWFESTGLANFLLYEYIV